MERSFQKLKKRREKIQQLLEKAAKPVGHVLLDEELLDEVTGMTEWPIALLGRFKEEFLKLPSEVLITTLKVHQRCFCIQDKEGKLQPNFILVSNIESKNPEQVIAGNERVINARLSDADFFFKNDLNIHLEDCLKKLETAIFQHGLGSLADKAHRLSRLSETIAELIHENSPTLARRAGLLAKCDLMSEMVLEFPTLQGTMGYYYALHDKEPAIIAQAIKDHYKPRYSNDTLPESLLSTCVALADRLDSLVGIIGTNKMPSSDKDPFGCRRAALGILRLLIEKELSLDLLDLLNKSKNDYNVKLPNPSVVTQTFHFVMERLQHWYLEKGIPAAVFMSVSAMHPTEPLDFDRRIAAVQHFQTLPEAQALIAANKRVGNILKKQTNSLDKQPIDVTLFDSEAEKMLYNVIKKTTALIDPLYKNKEYTKALSMLASLKEPVDIFFNEVMVMVDDPKKRQNRLALLATLQRLLSCVADITFLE